MGRKTWESLPDAFRPLPQRLNLILTRGTKVVGNDETVVTASTLNEGLKFLKRKGITNIFVIGGGEIYKEALRHKDCDKIYLTRILSSFECDKYFPHYESIFETGSGAFTVHEKNIHYGFRLLKKSQIKKD